MWQKGINKSPLETLGLMTARLARIVLYQKLEAGQDQLRAAGIENNIAQDYKVYAIKEFTAVKEQLEKKHVVMRRTPRSTF